MLGRGSRGGFILFMGAGDDDMSTFPLLRWDSLVSLLAFGVVCFTSFFLLVSFVSFLLFALAANAGMLLFSRILVQCGSTSHYSSAAYKYPAFEMPFAWLPFWGGMIEAMNTSSLPSNFVSFAAVSHTSCFAFVDME